MTMAEIASEVLIENYNSERSKTAITITLISIAEFDSMPQLLQVWQQYSERF